MTTAKDKNKKRPNLFISREEAEEMTKKQIEKGNLIKGMDITTESELDVAEKAFSKWYKYTLELFRRIFDNTSIADEFKHSYKGGWVLPAGPGPSPPPPPLSKKVSDFIENVQDYLDTLESILERLELIPETTERGQNFHNSQIPQIESKKIFVVHGHDEATKQSVSRFLEKLELIPIILHEQPNAGLTIIEKFENYSDTAFAVILLTPDDTCIDDGSKKRIFRARQNVIFELGYFIGKLGRQRVCALYEEGVEIPSDFQGVLYIPLDSKGLWKFELSKEIKQAGIDVDLNRIF